jgi:S1-C subfamily serine protease
MELLTGAPRARWTGWRALAGGAGLLALAGGAGLLAGCATVPADRTPVIRQALASTVQLGAEREGGGRRWASGVVVGSDQAGRSWVLTTRHFLEPAVGQRLFALVPGVRGRVQARVVATSPDSDLALLAVEGVVLPPVRLQESARLGDTVWVVSFPWGRRLTVVSGIVSQIAGDDGEVALEGPVRLVDAPAAYGTSGGGVFDAATGRLIGIVESYRTARVALGGTPERGVDIPWPGETTVVGIPAIRTFLERAGVARR